MHRQYKIGPFRKIGQGQARVIILTNFVKLEYLMLPAKFQDHMNLGSEEEDFKGFGHILALRPS